MTVETPAEAPISAEQPLADEAHAPTDNLPSLPRLQREMLLRASAAGSTAELIRSLIELLGQYVEPVAAIYFSRGEQGELTAAVRHKAAETEQRSRRIAKQLLAACQTACRAGQLEVRQQASPRRTILAAPIAVYGRDPEALGLVVRSDLPDEQVILLVQMLASHIVLWHVMAATRGDQSEATQSAALIELLDQVITARNLRHACYTLAGELQAFLKCQRVAVGLRTGGKGRCRLAAISGVAQFDKQSVLTQAIESALDEAVIREEVTHWPVVSDQHRHAALAHKKLCSLEEFKSVVSVPLRDANAQIMGVMLLLNESPVPLAEASNFLIAAETPLATALGTAQRLEGGRLARTARFASKLWSTSKGKLAAAAAALVVAAMFLPLPHKVHCECVVEPVTRRYVAAPFESSLEKSLVKPGDLVTQGQLLARLDGREVRWKRAGVAADRQQAVKRRDVAQATRNYSDGQIAKLEIEQLDLQLQLLDHRSENLEIRSPIEGIVASGDLERAEGAPLTIGQTLFEIAPLQSMIVELAVPDDEIAYVEQGQPIEVILNAYPRQSWSAVTGQIQPRSEIRDQQNVFIAEAMLDNTSGQLRPGMKGRAKVTAGRRPLGWILFHRPWEYLVKKLSW